MKKNASCPMKEHLGFIVALVVFAGFSLYGIMYFFNSTNLYLDNMQASVLASAGNAPVECSTCPRIPACDAFCEYTDVALGGSGEVYEIFTDVFSNHQNAIAIETLYKMGIINGHPDGSFKPENTLNRAELLTILTTAVDADFSGSAYDNCFIDVHDEWFAVFVCYAKSAGWVKGYSDGSFGPSNTVIKAEALKMTLEAFGYEIPKSVTEQPFADVAVDAWYAPYALVAKEHGVIGSTPTFDAAHEISRAEFVQMVYNAMAF